MQQIQGKQKSSQLKKILQKKFQENKKMKKNALQSIEQNQGKIHSTGENGKGKKVR